MSQTVKIRNIYLGEGLPKVCVPIVGRTEEEIVKSAEVVVAAAPDIVEWRMDFFEKVKDEKALVNTLARIRERLGDIALLSTFRTKGEGGELEATVEEYLKMNQAVINSRLSDAIDVEVFLGRETVESLVAAAHDANVVVVGSNHDFHKTPEKQIIVERLCYMQNLGVDVAKIAVMPNSREDVLTLLDATRIMKEEHPETPVITMSMGPKGVISRMTGEIFGSSLTFGMIGKASAPGQVPMEELKDILQKIHVYGG